MQCFCHTVVFLTKFLWTFSRTLLIKNQYFKAQQLKQLMLVKIYKFEPMRFNDSRDKLLTWIRKLLGFGRDEATAPQNRNCQLTGKFSQKKTHLTNIQNKNKIKKLQIVQMTYLKLMHASSYFSFDNWDRTEEW